MGIAGGAIIPLLYTSLRDQAHFSNPLSFLICMLPAYVYIFYYAVKGFRVGKPFALVAK
jgi:fucose permease